ncbi:hypothetical protein L596_029585 [Steinernema carpocapsae]|uniref:Uncharacterized protein n=1 Tax=Steinernema carpocapsae TaxID=34508 RepID=A0A4V5ZXI9_STECR|nr:hypothetical protein L596_029585 [Steinernema carpocapsae]
MDNVPVAFIERVIPLGRVSLANLADLEKLGPRWHSVAREVESKYNYNWIKLYNDVRKLVISNKGYNKDPVLPKDFKWVNAFTLDAKIQIRAKSSGNRLAREEPLELSPKLLAVSSIPCVGYESSLEMFDLDRQTESINLGKYLNCLQGPFIMIHVENVRGYAQELERILRRSVEANLTGKYRFLDSEFTPAVPDLLMEHWAKWNLTPRRSGYEARRFDRTIIFTGCNVQLRIPHIRKAIDTWIVDNKGIEDRRTAVENRAVRLPLLPRLHLNSPKIEC